MQGKAIAATLRLEAASSDPVDELWEVSVRPAGSHDARHVSLDVSDAADILYPIVTAKIEVSIVALMYNMSAPFTVLDRSKGHIDDVLEILRHRATSPRPLNQRESWWNA